MNCPRYREISFVLVYIPFQSDAIVTDGDSMNDSDNDFFLASFYYSFYWYAKTLDAALRENVSINDGESITKRLKGGSYEGVAGEAGQGCATLKFASVL